MAGIGGLCLWAGAVTAAIIFAVIGGGSAWLGTLAMDRHRYHRNVGLIAIDNRELHPGLTEDQRERMARRQYRRFGPGGQ